jgi:hypothetical protein
MVNLGWELKATNGLLCSDAEPQWKQLRVVEETSCVSPSPAGSMYSHTFLVVYLGENSVHPILPAARRRD